MRCTFGSHRSYLTSEDDKSIYLSIYLSLSLSLSVVLSLCTAPTLPLEVCVRLCYGSLRPLGYGDALESPIHYSTTYIVLVCVILSLPCDLWRSMASPNQ